MTECIWVRSSVSLCLFNIWKWSWFPEHFFDSCQTRWWCVHAVIFCKCVCWEELSSLECELRDHNNQSLSVLAEWFDVFLSMDKLPTTPLQFRYLSLAHRPESFHDACRFVVTKSQKDLPAFLMFVSPHWYVSAAFCVNVRLALRTAWKRKCSHIWQMCMETIRCGSPWMFPSWRIQILMPLFCAQWSCEHALFYVEFSSRPYINFQLFIHSCTNFSV